jgi:hypothetical protein
MDPSLEEFKKFTANQVRGWVEKRYSELSKYGPAIEDKEMTGRVLLEASAGAIKEDLSMTASHSDFLQCQLHKIKEGERGWRLQK